MPPARLSKQKTLSRLISSSASLLNVRKKPKDELMTVAAAFHSLDRDGSGKISVDELSEALTRPGGGAPLTYEEVRALVREFDEIRDGELQYEEFAVMWGSDACSATEPKPRKQPPPKSSQEQNPAAGGSMKANKPANEQRTKRTSSKDEADAAEADRTSFKRKQLRSAASLTAAEEAERAVTATMTKRANRISKETFERRLGGALLLKIPNISTVRSSLPDAPTGVGPLGSQQGSPAFQRQAQQHGSFTSAPKLADSTLAELMAAWDLNKNGELSRGELRRAVRVSLELSATDAEIDHLFNEFDADGGGAIDLKELRACLQALLDAAVAGQQEAESVRDIGDLSVQRANQLREAADVMQRIERIEAWLAEQQQGEELHPSIRLFQRLTMKKGAALNTNDQALTWEGVRDDAHISRKNFHRGVGELLGSRALSAEEIDKWFDAEKEADASTPSTGQAKYGGKPPSKMKREGSMVNLRSVLRDAKENTAAYTQDRACVAKRLKQLRETAAQQQDDMATQAAQGAAEARNKELAAQAAAKARAQAEAEAAKVKEEVRATKLRAAVQRKAEFETSVEKKRESAQQHLHL